jgi:amino acid transporter
MVNASLLVATIGSGMASQLGAARLLYAMGRSNALPRSFFGALDTVRQIPRNNVLFAGALALVGALTIGFEQGVELLNFGALVAFMGVNASSLVRYYLRSKLRKIIDGIVPLCGFLVCLGLWWSLNKSAKTAGVVWMLVGLGYGAVRTRGFREDLIKFELPGGA